ncbi:hypothetical protein Pint_30629 [Pistacia integerrima]|uniref:Uncharacterized protein n=1 Tax=Pistacia integerrima TaxID=434235 RepID=A0ACC0WWS6_9ROSI|nr:hypothetical protein Pint_30629 [Pistacia integerrima]
MRLIMVQELHSKLGATETLPSSVPRSLKNPNDFCKKVIPWRQEFKIFGKVRCKEENKDKPCNFNQMQTLFCRSFPFAEWQLCGILDSKKKVKYPGFQIQPNPQECSGLLLLSAADILSQLLPCNASLPPGLEVGKHFVGWNPGSSVKDILTYSIKTGPHLITGNGVGFKPDILDMDVMEKVLEVNIAYVGISSGANTVAALKLVQTPENKGKLIVHYLFIFSYSYPSLEDHKPNRSDEGKRIENVGSVRNVGSTWRVGGILAMSCAFGNRMLK